VTHRFCVEPGQLHADEVVFSAAQTHQLRSVLRLRAGDQVRVFDGVLPHDLVVQLTDVEHGTVVGAADYAPEPRTRLVAYPALLQRDKFETVLQKLTELGVSAISPVVTLRSVVRTPPDESRLDRWRDILREAAEQCGRGTLPALLQADSFAAALRTSEGTRLVAYERERERNLRDALVCRPPCVSLFVGPEGGFAPEEVECARATGAELVSLGPRVLRAETAAPLLAGLVLYELGDLSWPNDAGS